MNDVNHEIVALNAIHRAYENVGGIIECFNICNCNALTYLYEAEKFLNRIVLLLRDKDKNNHDKILYNYNEVKHFIRIIHVKIKEPYKSKAEGYLKETANCLEEFCMAYNNLKERCNHEQ